MTMTLSFLTVQSGDMHSFMKYYIFNCSHSPLRPKSADINPPDVMYILRIKKSDLSYMAEFKSDAAAGGRQSKEWCEEFSKVMSFHFMPRMTSQPWPRWKGHPIIWEPEGRRVEAEWSHSQAPCRRSGLRASAHESHIIHHITTVIRILGFNRQTLSYGGQRASWQVLSSLHFKGRRMRR